MAAGQNVPCTIAQWRGTFCSRLHQCHEETHRLRRPSLIAVIEIKVAREGVSEEEHQFPCPSFHLEGDLTRRSLQNLSTGPTRSALERTRLEASERRR